MAASPSSAAATETFASFDPLAGYSSTPALARAPSDAHLGADDIMPSSRASRSATGAKRRSGRRTRNGADAEEDGLDGNGSWERDSTRQRGTTTTSSVSSSRRKPRSMQPPKDPELFDSDEAAAAHAEAERASGWHHLPLFLVGLPPLGAIVHGRAENWSDAIILALVIFYLYQLIKVPWELYYASYARYVLPEGIEPGAPESTDPELAAHRKKSARALRRNELLSLALTLLVPVLGSSILHYARGLLSDPDRFINRFLIGLFAIASSVKPLLHFVKLIKRNSLYHQEVVHYPSSQVQQLQRRVDRLETELSQLSHNSVPLSTFQSLSSSLSSTLTPLQRQLRRQSLETQHAQLSSTERITQLDAAIDDLCLAFQAQEGDLAALREVVAASARSAAAAGRPAVLGSVIKHLVLFLASRDPHAQEKKHHGVAWFAFWPLTVPRALLGWAVAGSAKGAVRALGWEDDVAEAQGDKVGTGGRAQKARKAITQAPPLAAAAPVAADDGEGYYTEEEEEVLAALPARATVAPPPLRPTRRPAAPVVPGRLPVPSTGRRAAAALASQRTALAAHRVAAGAA